MLRGGQDTSGVFTFVPLDVAFGRKDGLVTIDMGGGGALLTRHTFVRRAVGVGYHFQHYSDATIYGSGSRGTDLHLFELIYWFERAR